MKKLNMLFVLGLVLLIMAMSASAEMMCPVTTTTHHATTTTHHVTTTTHHATTTTSSTTTTTQDHGCGNQGFNCECQNFYNSMDYYAIQKWEISGGNYQPSETNPLYSYYDITVNGDAKSADWTSDPDVYSVLMKAGNQRTEFDGGSSGSVSSGKKGISHITFCGKKNSGGGGGGGNGVPEFSGIAILFAVGITTAGLVYMRKRD